MNFRVFASLFTIIYVVNCEEHMMQVLEVKPQRVAEMVQRSQENTNNQIAEGNAEEAVKTDVRSGGSTTPPTPIIIGIDQVKPVLQHQPHIIVTGQKPQHPQIIVTGQKPQHSQIIVTEQKPQKPQIIITEQQPQQPQKPQIIITEQQPQQPQIIINEQVQPLPPSTVSVSTHSRHCVVLGRHGTCTSIPSFYSCIRGGGLLAPDIRKCSWIQGCCVRNLFSK